MKIVGQSEMFEKMKLIDSQGYALSDFSSAFSSISTFEGFFLYFKFQIQALGLLKSTSKLYCSASPKSGTSK